MSKVMKFEVPDISVHQGNVDFKSVRNAGYSKVFLRAGYGKNNVDQKFATNALACYNLSIPVAVYWFSYATDEKMAAEEAQYAIAQAEKYWKGCPVAFDLEYDTRRWAATQGVNIDKAKATAHAIAFLKVVLAAGYIPVLYTNRDYMKNYFDWNKISEAVPGAKLWFALYSNSIPASELALADLWQYTSKGSVPGIAGNVDLNKVYTDIWGSKVENVERPATVNLYVKSFQTAANADGYRDSNGCELQEDGIDGDNTQYVRKQIHLMIDFIGHLWVQRSIGEVVKWVQQRLNEIMNAGLIVTGEYDASTVQAVKNFQTKYNLTVDGIAGYNTIQAMFWN